MKVFMYGIEEKYVGGVQNKYGDAEYVDVTECYQDILALPADVVVVNIDCADSIELAAIRKYEAETKEVEVREYLYLDTETLQLLQQKANK